MVILISTVFLYKLGKLFLYMIIYYLVARFSYTLSKYIHKKFLK